MWHKTTFSKASELGDSLLLLPVILNKKPGYCDLTLSHVTFLTATSPAALRLTLRGVGAVVSTLATLATAKTRNHRAYYYAY